ncbi:hypothetical protein LEP1GSC071_0401 [Leptospira santarosai str. JET]|nr:hypothetical protein LEP1GSC071_0401 [Leptospira santarosai str. JET]EPG82795.1 hypothetical protein LEP1GSC048_2988 [Leptospira santarosai serovar Shermani str. 1342KT]
MESRNCLFFKIHIFENEIRILFSLNIKPFPNFTTKTYKTILRVCSKVTIQDLPQKNIIF